MEIKQLSQDQQIAVALMNLPPLETQQVWASLTNEEQTYFSQVYAELPPLAQGTCQAVLELFAF